MCERQQAQTAAEKSSAASGHISQQARPDSCDKHLGMQSPPRTENEFAALTTLQSRTTVFLRGPVVHPGATVVCRTRCQHSKEEICLLVITSDHRAAEGRGRCDGRHVKELTWASFRLHLVNGKNDDHLLNPSIAAHS